MIKINKETQLFIKQNIDKDINTILLSKSIPENIDVKFAAQQIEARQKAKIKLPSLYLNNAFIFPSKLSMEQCSSEITAKYKSQFVKDKSVIDITGGLGIDAVFMSETASEFTYIEENKELFEIAESNFELLGKKNIIPECCDSIEYLKNTNSKFDCIYADPARRDTHKNKTVFFADCTPDIIKNKELIFSKSESLLIKASPMLDISQAIKELGNIVTDVHVVAIKNDCKELLFVCKKGTYIPNIHCINITNDKEQSVFNFALSEEQESKLILAEKVCDYLYEPNVSVLKSGAFKLITQRFNVEKLHVNSHLYTSNNLHIDFPGRIFDVKNVFPAKPTLIKQYLPDKQANVSVRNFPLSAEQFKNTYKIKNGGDIYLFATTLKNGEKVVIYCQKVM